MQFVYPTFLFALSAIAIPIIIHLFHFRRYKKVIFSDLRFLKQVQEQNKSKQKLKDLLVLIARILAIIFLVLAFAQPYIPSVHSLALKGTKSISIFVDNSFSMNNEGSEGNLLESAKNKARAIVNAYSADDQFQILTHDFEGKHQRLVNKTDALTWIDEVKISPASVPLSNIMQRQKQALEKAGTDPKLQYIVSDFQQQMCDVDEIEKDSTGIINFVPVTANKQQNVSVDSVWLTSPVVQLNTPVTMKTRIRNHSDGTAENIAVTLVINGQQKGLQNVTCSANETEEVTFTFTPSGSVLQQGEISILDHPITFDDKLFFSFIPVTTYNVLSINGGEPSIFISKLFESDNTYKLTQASQNQLNYGLFGNQQLIILNEPQTISSGLSQELKKYIEQGGQLLIIPPTTAATVLNSFLNELALPIYGTALKQQVKVSSLNTQDAMFKNVFQRLPQNMDLPSVSQYYALQRNNTSKGRTLMELNNGQPFVWQASYQKGNIVLLAAPLQTSWSNLPQHAVYVPLMLKLGTGKPQHEQLYYTIGMAQWIPFQQNMASDKLVRLWGNGTELALQTSMRNGKTNLYLEQPLAKAGIYNIAPQGSKTPLQLVGLNFNRKESDMRTWEPTKMEAYIGSLPGARITSENTAVLQNSISNELNGTPFWRYCVWLTLVFVLIEILLLRILK
jgi:Aerotolerance regulator N-terminal